MQGNHMTELVALIGVGAMGKAILSRMKIANKKVRAYDVTDTGREAARTAGAEVASSPADAARGATHIHIFVRTDDQTIDVTLGKNGVLETAALGSLLILHPTVLPQTTTKIGAAARAKGLRVLDVPITSVPSKVQAGEAAFLVGGDKDVAESTRDYMLELGGSYYHFGPLGSGNVAKLAKNYANAAQRIAVDESIRVAEGGGLDPKQFLDMMRDMDQGSLVSDWEHTWTVKDRNAIHRPATNLFNKDLALTAEYATLIGLKLPVAQAAAKIGMEWSERWAREKAKQSA
jgi:3-hydroxyisobutyrate dehydrogenase-like beta-hydroxyacid dehydrogenase